MKKFQVIFLIIILSLILCACKTQDEEVNQHFYDKYANTENLDAFSGTQSHYAMKIVFEKTEVRLYLDRNESNIWSGYLSLREEDDEIESIPIYVDKDELVIQTFPEKRVSMDVLFFRQFRAESCVIEESTPDILLAPPGLEEVIGTYSEEEMKEYMEMLYDDVISNLTSFEKEEEYFQAIDELNGFNFIRNTGDPTKPGCNLHFGFSGGECWPSGIDGLGDVSLIFSEGSNLP